MRMALLLRLAIPLLLALLSATVFFRMLILLVLALAFAGFLFLVYRLTGKRVGEVGPTSRKGKRFIDSSYTVLDDSEDTKK